MSFAIKIYDKPNSGALRDIGRQAHLDYLRKFEAQTLFAGPFLTDDGSTELGSLRILNLPDRTAAEHNVAEEPYIRVGAQEVWTIHRWSPSVPYTFRDCPRKEGHIQFLIQAMDKLNQEELRRTLQKEQQAYEESHPDLYITRGVVVTDNGDKEIGSLMIIDVPDLKTARAFWEKDPFSRSGLYEGVEFYRWRFGRAFDID
ncbi:MAG: hypothetical protein C0390_08425 [Syntrophus sp. (in: bacteria)]|nr:hypothetical protein [Syntrophus sp. (in: bacteria)]